MNHPTESYLLTRAEARAFLAGQALTNKPPRPNRKLVVCTPGSTRVYGLARTNTAPDMRPRYLLTLDLA